jgi:hypothetical protein
MTTSLTSLVVSPCYFFQHQQPLECHHPPLERQRLCNFTTMSTAFDHIISEFPHPIIEPIVGTPTSETIATSHLHLNANAASVQSNLEDGQLGLLAPTVLDADMCATLSAQPCVTPVNPGSTPNVPPRDFRRQHGIVMVRGHTAALRIF